MNTTVRTGSRRNPGQAAPGARPPLPGRPRRPGAPGGVPARPAPPAARTAVRPTASPARTRARAAAVRRPVSRTPFILLVLGLLGSGLICLLVINTTLAAASFRINALQQGNIQASQRVEELQQQVAADQSHGVHRAAGAEARPADPADPQLH